MNYGRVARRFGGRRSFGRRSFGRRGRGFGRGGFKSARRFKGQAKKLHRMNFAPRGGFHI